MYLSYVLLIMRGCIVPGNSRRYRRRELPLRPPQTSASPSLQNQTFLRKWLPLESATGFLTFFKISLDGAALARDGGTPVFGKEGNEQ
jgi:hypothetical protein